jgi:hypothetical protein
MAWAIWLAGWVVLYVLWGNTIQHDVYSPYWSFADFGRGIVVLAWGLCGPWAIGPAIDEIKLWFDRRRRHRVGTKRPGP